jgi:hypothetical protein
MKLPIVRVINLAKIAMKLQVQILVGLRWLNEMHIKFHGCKFLTAKFTANVEVKVEVKNYTFFFSEGFCSPVVQKDKICSVHWTLVRPAPTQQSNNQTLVAS